MKIEAVTVCVGYSDFLEQTASHNRRLLDKWVVATRPSDEATRQVCSRHSIDVVLTDDFGTEFAKAKGINSALQQLNGDDWLLHIDGDIVLPYDLGECLENAQITPGNIYGCNRLSLPGWECWQEAQKQGLYSRYHGWLVEYRDRPKGSYVSGVPCGRVTGYTPIGFFQLWHGTETLSWGHSRKWYPTKHNNAARTDTQFACLWDRTHRLMIPELMVFHLEEPNAPMGVNWKGRKTPPFGPGVAGDVKKRYS